MHKNVISLDRARGAVAFSFMRSSMYENRRATLCAEKKLQLTRIEEQFRNSGGKSGLPAIDIGAHEEVLKFKCSDGGLYFHFSLERNCNVLTDFWLADGGSRSKFPPITTGGGSALWITSERLVAARAAFANLFYPAIASARRAFLTHQRPTKAGDIFGAYTPTEGHHSWNLICEHYEKKGNQFDALIDVIRMNAVMAGTPLSNTKALPEWSVLRENLAAPEQLGSSYARRIVFGEMVCWLGGRSGIRETVQHRWHLVLTRGFRRDSFEKCARLEQSLQLHDEAKDILGSVIGRTQGNKLVRYRVARCAALLDGDLLADDIVLRLLRAELIWNVGRILSDRARVAMQQVSEQRAASSTTEPSRHLRHLALLADFVALSHSYFGAEHPEVDTLTATKARFRLQNEPDVDVDHVMRVATYERVVSALSGQFATTTEPADTGSNGPIRRHDELLKILSEILAESHRDGPGNVLVE